MDCSTRSDLSLLGERQPSLHLAAPVAQPITTQNASPNDRTMQEVLQLQTKHAKVEGHFRTQDRHTPSSEWKALKLNEVKRPAKQRRGLSIGDGKSDGNRLFCGYSAHPYNFKGYVLRCLRCAAVAHDRCVDQHSKFIIWNARTCPDCNDECPSCYHKYVLDEKKWEHSSLRHCQAIIPLKWKYELESTIHPPEDTSGSKTSTMFITYTISED